MISGGGIHQTLLKSSDEKVVTKPMYIIIIYCILALLQCCSVAVLLSSINSICYKLKKNATHLGGKNARMQMKNARMQVCKVVCVLVTTVKSRGYKARMQECKKLWKTHLSLLLSLSLVTTFEYVSLFISTLGENSYG